MVKITVNKQNVDSKTLLLDGATLVKKLTGSSRILADLGRPVKNPQG